MEPNPFDERIELLQSPEFQNYAGLAREIGADNWMSEDNPVRFLSAWTRRLAFILEDHVAPGLSAYPDRIIECATMIRWSDDATLTEACAEARKLIEAHDWVDGWPEDRAGYCMVSICLAGTIGIHDEKSRWSAEAAKKIWRYVTNADMTHNWIVDVSERAWLRYVFAQVVGETRGITRRERSRIER